MIVKSKVWIAGYREALKDIQTVFLNTLTSVSDDAALEARRAYKLVSTVCEDADKVMEEIEKDAP